MGNAGVAGNTLQTINTRDSISVFVFVDEIMFRSNSSHPSNGLSSIIFQIVRTALEYGPGCRGKPAAMKRTYFGGEMVDTWLQVRALSPKS